MTLADELRQQADNCDGCELDGTAGFMRSAASRLDALEAELREATAAKYPGCKVLSLGEACPCKLCRLEAALVAAQARVTALEAEQRAGPISSTERYDIELPWRRELAMSEMTAQNERELHAAWQKRAEQAEASLGDECAVKALAIHDRDKAESALAEMTAERDKMADEALTREAQLQAAHALGARLAEELVLLEGHIPSQEGVTAVRPLLAAARAQGWLLKEQP